MSEKQDAAYVLHEIKTPISVINGYAQLALQCGARDEKLVKNALQSIIDETENILWMIQTLQSMAEWEQTKPERIEIKKIVEESIKEYANMIPERVWQCDCNNDGIVNISFWGLKGVLRSLFDNAVKYTGHGGIIKTEVRTEGKNAIIRIIDNGIGIPAEDIDHIFDLSYRASNAKNINGSGIGLYLVKKVLESSGGKIMVKSFPHIGSQFVIQLPVIENAADGCIIKMLHKES